jgi:hypothetical protein
MKHIAIYFFVFVCAGIGVATYLAAAPSTLPLSKYVPAGPLLYLEAKDLSSLLKDWNSSPQKQQWVASNNYEVFSRSRLFLRLKGASDQFATAAGLAPDTNFLSQVAGEQSAVAIYDIGNLQFLYITRLPSAKSMETALWQTRAKFEPRSAGGTNFYLRRDPESHREVAFAVSGDYLLLATREELMAGALQLISGKQDRTVESEQWWAQSTSATGSAGDLRLVLDLASLVPNGYFRTYWVQQNITDLKQYSASVSDLFRSGKQYVEERVLIRKETGNAAPAEGLNAAAELAGLVAPDSGLYVASANPTAQSAFALLETKLLAPHFGPAPASQAAPQVPLTSGRAGEGSDLETRIDQSPSQRPTGAQTTTALQELLNKTPLLASLQVQSTERDKVGVFVRIRSAVVLEAASDWNQSTVQTALTDFVRPVLTASQLGVNWRQKSGFQELDGLLPLTLSVRGKILVISDDDTFTESILAKLGRKSERQPATLLAGFNHQSEKASFARFAGVVDRVNAGGTDNDNAERKLQFFSGNISSLSSSLAAVSTEKIEVRPDGGKVRQTVTYEWSQ